MSKLLAKYRDKPTYKLAQRIRAYERSHPFSLCVLSRQDQASLADAIYHANQGQPHNC